MADGDGASDSETAPPSPLSPPSPPETVSILPLMVHPATGAVRVVLALDRAYREIEGMQICNRDGVHDRLLPKRASLVRWTDLGGHRTPEDGDLFDTAAREALEETAMCIDLGCGPGVSAAALWRRGERVVARLDMARHARSHTTLVVAIPWQPLVSAFALAYTSIMDVLPLWNRVLRARVWLASHRASPCMPIGRAEHAAALRAWRARVRSMPPHPALDARAGIRFACLEKCRVAVFTPQQIAAALHGDNRMSVSGFYVRPVCVTALIWALQHVLANHPR